MKIRKQEIIKAIEKVAKMNEKNGYGSQEAIIRAIIEVEQVVNSISNYKISILDILK